jgi:hypothetical protein
MRHLESRKAQVLEKPSPRRLGLARDQRQRLPLHGFGVIMGITRSISEMKNLCPQPQPQLKFTDDMTLIFRQQFQAFCGIFRPHRSISNHSRLAATMV